MGMGGQGGAAVSFIHGRINDLIRRHSAANATQIGGTHYKACAIEPWDFAAANHMDGFQHAIVKYVTRWRGKDGVQALHKAKHYLDKYIELIEHGYPDTDPAYFIEQLQRKMLAAELPPADLEDPA